MEVIDNLTYGHIFSEGKLIYKIIRFFFPPKLQIGVSKSDFIWHWRKGNIRIIPERKIKMECTLGMYIMGHYIANIRHLKINGAIYRHINAFEIGKNNLSECIGMQLSINKDVCMINFFMVFFL